MPANYYPPTTGNQAADRALRYAFDYIHTLRGQVTNLTQTTQTMAAQIKALPGQTIAAAQATGSSPINTTALVGQTTSQQPSAIPILTALPLPGDPNYGNPVNTGGTTYLYDPGSGTYVPA